MGPRLRIPLVVLTVFSLHAVRHVRAQDLSRLGIGWTCTSLDLDVFVKPEEKKIEVRGVMNLRLDLEESFGPTLIINGRSENMRMLEMRSDPAASDVQYNLAVNEEFPNARATDVRFEKPFSRGDEISVSFTYESIDQGSQFKVLPEIAFASWTEAWHPVPAFDFEHIALSRALASTGRTTFHLPKGWTAAAEGSLLEHGETEQGVVETWRLESPLARSFAAGPFTRGSHSFDGREVNVFLLSAKATSAQDQAVILAKAMLAMERKFGPYPYPSYSIIEIPENKGITWYAASQQGLIFARSSGFDYEGGNLPLFAHEMAHGWWGNLVGTSGDGSILCSESLAQYGAVVAIESIEGVAARDEFLNYSRLGYNPVQCANGFFHIWRQGHDKPMIQLTSGGWDHNLSDSKGYWVYHMLRHHVGDELFFETLRGLIRDYAGKRLTLDGMRAAFLSAAPDLNLDVFFEQWLERTGAPILDLDWWSIDRGKGAHIEIDQLQPGAPYSLELEIRIETADGNVLHKTASLEEGHHAFEFETESRPVNVRLDPNRKILMWRPEYGSRPEATEPKPEEADD